MVVKLVLIGRENRNLSFLVVFGVFWRFLGQVNFRKSAFLTFFLHENAALPEIKPDKLTQVKFTNRSENVQNVRAPTG